MEQVQANNKKKAVRVYISGEIVITARLAKEMNVRPGDRVALFTDRRGASCMEMYLAKSETGIEVHPKRSDRRQQNACCIYSKEYAKRILMGAKNGIFRVGETVEKDGVNYHTIIYLKNYAV